MKRLWPLALLALAPSLSAHAYSYTCEDYRLMIRPDPKLVIVRRENEICPEVPEATYRSVKNRRMTRLKQVDRFEERTKNGVIDSISNSSYPNASCRRTYKLGLSENVVIWISDGVFQGDPDGTLEIEYADLKKPLESIRLKCQIDHP